VTEAKSNTASLLEPLGEGASRARYLSHHAGDAGAAGAGAGMQAGSWRASEAPPASLRRFL
jgi:hypothetical protein